MEITVMVAMPNVVVGSKLSNPQLLGLEIINIKNSQQNFRTYCLVELKLLCVMNLKSLKKLVY